MFGTSSLGINPTSWVATSCGVPGFPGSPREVATKGASKDSPSPTPGSQVWEPSSWETTPTFPQLREPARTEPEAAGHLQWATAERAQKSSERSSLTCSSSHPLCKTHHLGCPGSSDPTRWLPVFLAAEKPGIPEALIQSDDTTSVRFGREMGSNSLTSLIMRTKLILLQIGKVRKEAPDLQILLEFCIAKKIHEV